MRELVDPEAAAGAARALGVVEYEIIGRDVPVDEVMRRAAQPAVEPLRLGLARAFGDVDPQQPVAHEQRAGDPCLDGLLVLGADHEPVHHRVDVPHLRFI